MKIEIEHSMSRKVLGHLELSIVPRQKEYVSLDGQIYRVLKVLHSEKNISLLVDSDYYYEPNLP